MRRGETWATLLGLSRRFGRARGAVGDLLAQASSALTRMRENAHTLSDFRVSTLSIECEPCGRRGRYNVARLMEKYGDAKLPELLQALAQCHKDPLSMRDRCRARYGEDSRLS
jgi:hypothetical protein